MARALMVTVVASALLILALLGGPVLSGLLPGPSRAPADARPTPEGSVRSGHSSPKPTHRTRTRVVRAGDTLYSIALAAYGNAERWRAIYRANRALIPDPRALKVGTRLTIP
jgi:nucleoid-associated protein YgaU